MTAFTLALPGALDDTGAEGLGDGFGPVGRAVEDDDDLVGEAQAAEAIGQLALLVADAHHRTDHAACSTA